LTVGQWVPTVEAHLASGGGVAGHFGYPGEVAQAALFLASDASAFVSGSILTIDGGITAS
jgi:NAD(P)-dependent dehydrogenase (short-subunit alcohol dehydrogenase family)